MSYQIKRECWNDKTYNGYEDAPYWRIDFKGFDFPVKASIPYTDKPVEFYKWWCDNKEQVTMTFQEKLILFDKVYNLKPNLLKAEHRKTINK